MMLSSAFYITCGTVLLLISMGIYILRAKQRTTLHYVLLMVIAEIFVWNGAVLMQGLFGHIRELYIFWENVTYLGASLVPVGLFILARTYADTGKGFSKKTLLLFVIPILTQVIIWTNDAHGWFYVEYGLGIAPNVPGPYFFVHAAYSYICMIIGLGQLSYYAVKNSGVWSVQALLIIIGSIIPLISNVFYTLGLFGFDVYSTPIAFTSTILLYLLGMFRFNLLRITPIALQTVINRISDSFIVIDTEMSIIDFNKTFEDNFKYLKGLRKGENFYKILGESGRNDISADQFRNIIVSAAEASDTLIKDIEVNSDAGKQYFTIEFTPIRQRGRNTAVVLLFKNVTQHIHDMEQIQNNQAVLLERERLASLGQLIGGIAHNLKTPIMSVAGGIDQIRDLSEEYAASIDDEEVTSEDHQEIAGEMQEWLGKMKGHMAYMSDIITTVKDQAAKFAHPEEEWFTLDEALKRVNILMMHEITKNRCRYTEAIEVDRSLRIGGDVNAMVQIMDNIIVNAIQAYDGRGGEIALHVTREGSMLQIVISDFGKGIEEKVKNRLFKEMVTTKGKHGTGLGLYMSYSTVKGMFGGDMWVESSVGVGTDFYIQLPIRDEMNTGGQQYAQV